MGAIHDFEAIPGFNIVAKIDDMGTRRIPDNQSGGKMYHLCSVSQHFVHGIFHITSGTTIAAGIPDNFNFPVLVPAERTFSISQCSEALSSRARTVAVTNDYTDLGFFFHVASCCKMYL
jgi:hypothetical protein